MKLSVLFMIFCIVATKSGLTQKVKFTPGSYVNQGGDTLKGYISIKNTNSVSTFDFKEQPEDDKVYTVLLDTCKSLSSESANFVTWLISRNMTYVDKFNFTIRNVDSFLTASIPMRLLYKGRQLSLYYYYDVKDHFFVYDETRMQELLVRYRYPNQLERMQNVKINSPSYYVYPVYRDQIMTLVSGKLTRTQKFLVENAEYEKMSLIKVFKSLDK